MNPQRYISPRMLAVYNAFEESYAREGGATIKRLGERLGINAKTVWTAIKKLEAVGALDRDRELTSKNGQPLYKLTGKGFGNLPVRAHFNPPSDNYKCAWCGEARQRGIKCGGFKKMETGEWFCSLVCLTEDSELIESEKAATPEHEPKG